MKRISLCTKIFLSLFFVFLVVTEVHKKPATPIIPEVKISQGEAAAAFSTNVSGTYSTAARLGPESFDCSGFVYYVMQNFCADFPDGSTKTQICFGTPVAHSALKQYNDTQCLLAGDLIFFDYEEDGTPNHVGIYLGDGAFRHCALSGVSTTSLSSPCRRGESTPFYSTVCAVRRIETK